MPAILNIDFLATTRQRLSDFSEILHEKAERHANKDHVIKTAFFIIQDSGRLPS